MLESVMWRGVRCWIESEDLAMASWSVEVMIMAWGVCGLFLLLMIFRWAIGICCDLALRD